MKNKNSRTQFPASLLIALALAPAAYGAGTFAATGSLNTGRYSHTATLLPNGKVLVAGGFEPRQDFTAVPQASVELFDPATGTWTSATSLSAARGGHTATRLPNGKVLVVSGIYGGGDSAELYDPATGKWASAGKLTTARNAEHTATLLPNGKVLIAGGAHPVFSDSVLANAELYDPATGMWTATASLKGPRVRHTATLLPNGKVLVAGGSDADGNPLDSAELYDSTTGTWTPTGSLNDRRSSYTAVVLANGKVLVVAGFGLDQVGKGRYLSSTELYDPATGVWTRSGNLTTQRLGPTATLLPNGQVLITGGYGTGNPAPTLATAELYDPASGTSTATGNLNVRRSAHTATLLSNGRVMLAAGRTTGSLNFARTELFSESDILPFVPTPSPVSTPTRLPEGNFRFHFTNVSGLPFIAVATDDVTTPPGSWSFVGVGIETTPGQYEFTDPDAANHPYRFYQVRLP